MCVLPWRERLEGSELPLYYKTELKTKGASGTVVDEIAVAGQRRRRNFVHFSVCKRTLSLLAATVFDCSEVRFPVSSLVKYINLIHDISDRWKSKKQPAV